MDSLSKVMERHQAFNDVGYFAMLGQEYEIAVDYFERAISESPIYYERAKQNLKKAKRLLHEQPPVKLTQGSQVKPSGQITLYNAQPLKL